MHPLVPIPRSAVTIRPATMDDLKFIDELQSAHTKQVGWMPTKALVGKIRLGHVIVAIEGPHPDPLPGGEGTRVGYCIGSDQYFKRDDVGIIYQMNVVPDRRRSLVGATLVK